jgi:hypothetical protein
MGDHMSVGGVPSWTVAAASVQGADHVHNNTPCQDAHAVRFAKPGWIVAAVADGAGSASRAEQGAALAVKEAADRAEALVKHPPAEWGQSVFELFRDTKKVVAAEALRASEPARAFASTLLLSILGPELLVTGHVGDGAIVHQRADESLETVSPPLECESADQTVFLVSRDALDVLRVVVRREAHTAVAMFTDGLQWMALDYPGWRPRPGFLNPIFSHFRRSPLEGDEPAAFLGSVRVREGTGDDVTLVVATRSQPIEAARVEDSSRGGRRLGWFFPWGRDPRKSVRDDSRSRVNFFAPPAGAREPGPRPGGRAR